MRMATVLTTEDLPGLHCPRCKSTSYTVLVSNRRGSRRLPLGKREVTKSYIWRCEGACRIVHPIADEAVPRILEIAEQIKAERTLAWEVPTAVAA